MLLKLIFLLDILSMLMCIHALYGETIKWNIATMLAVILLLTIFVAVNSLQLSRVHTILAYIVIWGYCVIHFKSSYLKAVAAIIWYAVIVASLEFSCVVIMSLINWPREEMRTLSANLLVFAVSAAIFPRLKLNKLLTMRLTKNRVLYLITAIMGFPVLLAVLQSKLQKGIAAEYFVFAIPAAFFFFIFFVRWLTEKEQVEKLKQEIILVESNQKSFQRLIADMRLRQHEFGNQISAILATHYTCTTYEQIVSEQQKFYKQIKADQEHIALLKLNNIIFAGFLYHKIMEAEEDGIKVHVCVAASMEKYENKNYDLVQAVGILLDNAVEALVNRPIGRELILIVREESEGACIIVRNRQEYVPYQDLEKWFEYGAGSKGFGRGLGLYHAKILCEKNGWNIGCRNLAEEKENWIEFKIELKG